MIYSLSLMLKTWLKAQLKKVNTRSTGSQTPAASSVCENTPAQSSNKGLTH